MATSYNGWPASPDKAEIGVVSSAVFSGGAKAGDVTIVLGYVARQLDARVEPCVDDKELGLHLQGEREQPGSQPVLPRLRDTAIDWNAPDHPVTGSSGTFTQAQRGTIYAILDEGRARVVAGGLRRDALRDLRGPGRPGPGGRRAGRRRTPCNLEGDWFDMATEEDLRRIKSARSWTAGWPPSAPPPGPPRSTTGAAAKRDVGPGVRAGAAGRRRAGRTCRPRPGPSCSGTTPPAPGCWPRPPTTRTPPPTGSHHRAPVEQASRMDPPIRDIPSTCPGVALTPRSQQVGHHPARSAGTATRPARSRPPPA